MTRAFVKAFVCGAAGALAWILCEPFFPKTVSPRGFNFDPQWLAVEQVFTLLIGSFVGVAAGWLHGVERGGKRNVLISAALGLIFGAVGASFGKTIGSMIYMVMGGGPNSPTNMVARAAAFTPWGLAIGAAVGASQRSVRSLVSGAIGGGVAGFVTGALFDPVSYVLSGLTSPGPVSQTVQREVGAPGRAIMAFGLGLLIGLFTALVDLATRRAWLRLVLGRNEGKEWPVDASQTLIGRDERAHVPLFGDPTIPQLAAVIDKQGGQYVLRDPGSPLGVGHNGMRVSQAVLSNGDTIQIGNLNFQFMMRHGSAGAAEGRAKAMPVGPPGAHQPQPGYQPPPQQAPYTPQQVQPVQPTVAMPPTGVTQAVQPAPGYAPQGPTLVALNGPLTGQRFPLQGPLEIGREAQGIGLPFDAQASRRHVALAPAPGGAQVTDLGSTNGTFVNGQRVQTAFVRPGDTLTVGSTQFRVE